MATFKFLIVLLTLLVVQLSEATRPLSSNTDLPVFNGTKWAVLVAGSNNYFNYRHQADVCHAYQILKRGGLKDENIIVFMYDDIANNKYNPRPGVIINSPNGSDVYAGVPKDYTGENVTAANFYAVLLGNASALTGGSGKVVASSPLDKIFVYYTDHGGPGILGMPNMPFIYANDLIQVLETKHAMGTYSEMVIYVEACESGSIFEGLIPKTLNIYVTTASNANESSYGTYCPGMTPPPPKEYMTCLGDLYSVSWMEDSDLKDLATETLEEQYLTKYSPRMTLEQLFGNMSIKWVVSDPLVTSFVNQSQIRLLTNKQSDGLFCWLPSLTTNMAIGDASLFPREVKMRTLNNYSSYGSHVMQYGTQCISSETVSVYQGSCPVKLSANPLQSFESMGVVDQREADLHSMWHMYKKWTGEPQEKEELLKNIKEITAHRSHLDSSVNTIKFQLLGDQQHGSQRGGGWPLVNDWGCLKSMVRTFETHCGSLTQYGMKHTRTFANVCNNGVSMEAMDEVANATCGSYNMGQWDPTIVGFSA